MDGIELVGRARRSLRVIQPHREGFLATAAGDTERAAELLVRLFGEESPTPELLSLL